MLYYIFNGRKCICSTRFLLSLRSLPLSFSKCGGFRRGFQGRQADQVAGMAGGWLSGSSGSQARSGRGVLGGGVPWRKYEGRGRTRRVAAAL